MTYLSNCFRNKSIQGIGKWILTLPLVYLLAACNLDGPTTELETKDKKIVLSASVADYIPVMFAGSGIGDPVESTISNLYVFLFPTASGQSLISYYVDKADFGGGTWDNGEKTINLDLTQAEVGSRLVYLIANCANIKDDLDAVVLPADLDDILFTTAQPWSDQLTTPLLMYGSATHNFINNQLLDQVVLERALAKLELNIKLSSGFQTTPTTVDGKMTEYQYQFIHFDTNTHLIKPSSKPNNTASSLPTRWALSDAVLASGKVVQLNLFTYLNERDQAGAAIEIILPYVYEGLLPPPEFGDENYTLPLPAVIKRNHWYVFEVEI